MPADWFYLTDDVWYDKMAYEGYVAVASTKEKKSKFTASVNELVVARVDEQAAKLNVSRSEIVEEAMEMWLRSKAEQEEERYFMAAAAEMNADARGWNALTSRAVTDKLEQ